MGAKLKFTPELGQAICAMVRSGVTVGVAASASRIARGTVYDWKSRGDRGEPEFAEFAVDLEEALASVEVVITKNVIAFSREDWKAGAFWLKARNREVYGEEVTIRHLQKGMQDMLSDVRPHMSDGAYGELLNALAQAMGIESLVGGAEALSGDEDPTH